MDQGEGSSGSSRDSAAAGRRFGRYLLLEAIDRGGMAEVYRAVSHGPGGFQRQFVIKRIRKEKAASREFVEMFVNEARISALLEHPNIVQVYDFGQVDGDYFLAMEYLRGRNLLAVGRRLRRQRQLLAPDITAYVAREVARGLHYAHTLSNMGEPLGIVHRDVSPSNIMLLRTGGVKLLDFGIARATMKLRSLTPIGGLIKGKLAYLAPEQVRGQKVDGRSDVFALGVVIWEALTGLRLFHHTNDLDTMRNVLHRPIPKPSELRPEVPVAIDAVLGRALERDLDKRYPDAAAMAADLDEHLREARFSPETVVTLIADLFAGEDTAKDLPLPDETALAARSTGARNQVSSGSLLPPAIAPMPAPALADQGYATESAVHRLAALAERKRRKRVLQVASGSLAAAAVGVFVFALVGRSAAPGVSTSAAPAPAQPTRAVASAPVTSPASESPVASAPELPAAMPASASPAVAAVAVAFGPTSGTRSKGGASAPLPRGDSDGETGRGRRTQALSPRGKRALALGVGALQSGEYLRAAIQLEEAVQAAPSNPEALAALAEAEFELARYSLAVGHARRAAALAPRNARYQALLGDSYFKLRRFREASQSYAAALAISPHDESFRERKARSDAALPPRTNAAAE